MAHNWNEFKDTYNTWNDTNFKTTKDFIKYLYKKHDYYIGPLAKELGVSWGTIKTYLRELGLYVKKSKGGNNYIDRPIGKKEQMLINARPNVLSNLTQRQICERYGISKEYCCKVLGKHKLKYRKKTIKGDNNGGR